MRRLKFSRLSLFGIATAFLLVATVVAAEPVSLKIKFPPGQIDHQTNSMEMEQTVSSDKLPAPKTQSMKMVAKTTLKQIKSDASGSTVELTYDSMKLSGSLFEALSNQLDKTLDAFVGQKLTLHFTPAGMVDKVDGVDAITAKLPAGIGQTAIKGFLNEARIKDEFNSGIQQLLPKKPVSVGDTWETEILHKLATVEVKIKSKVKFVALDDRDGHRIARLEFTGKGNVDSNASPLMPKMNFENLQQDGTAEFDLTRGWLTSQAVEQTMKGDLQINRGAGNPISLTLDQTVKAKTITVPASATDKNSPKESSHPASENPSQSTESKAVESEKKSDKPETKTGGKS